MNDLNSTLEAAILGETDIARKTVDFLYDNLHTNLIGAGIPAIMIFIFIWLHEPKPAYLAWIIIVFLVIFFRIMLLYLYKHADIEKNTVAFWKRRFDVGVFASGIMWGLLGSLITPHMSTSLQILILISFAGFISGSVITYRASLRSFFCLSVPIMLPTAVAYLLRADAENIAIGLILIVYLLMMIIFALKLNKRFVNALMVKAQNKFLIESLEEGQQKYKNEAALSRRLTLAIESSTDAICIMGSGGSITYSNPAFTSITGWSGEDILGKDIRVLRSGKMPNVFYRDLWLTLKRGRDWHGVIISRRKSGDQLDLTSDDRLNDEMLYWAQATIAPIKDEANTVTGFIAVQRDITAEVKIEKREANERESAIIRVNVSNILQQQSRLKERVESVLEILVQFEGLHIQQKAGVFLLPKNRCQLEMYAMHGAFTDEFINKEKCIKLGSCLCGRVALSGDLLISDDCFKDKMHEHSFENMVAHGHYIVPLKNAGEILGVMFLYTDPYPSRNKARLEVLNQVGDMLGLAIANEIAHQETVRARQIAENAARDKAEFLANMSHEIRTPMNGVLGMLELLRDKPLDEESEQYLRTAQGAAEILMNVINDILDLSKIESGKMIIEPHEFSLLKTSNHIVDMFLEQASRKGLIINRSFSNDLPEFVKGDSLRLQQILSNLVSNAIKFTKQGTIDVNIKKLSERNGSVDIQFEIVDTGIGIAEDIQPKIFEPFSQADGSTSRQYGGTGLGLSISTHLLKLLGGSSMQLESEEGVGSTFRFNLPFRLIDVNKMKEKQQLTKAEIALLNDKLKASQSHILLAEDNPMNQMVAEQLLKKMGCRVTVVENGKQAVDAITQNRFEIILMDCQMPEMDGYESTEEIRKYEKENNIEPVPIIALTANAMEGDREKCLAAGMNDYMSKPFTKKQLQETLISWLIFEIQGA